MSCERRNQNTTGSSGVNAAWREARVQAFRQRCTHSVWICIHTHANREVSPHTRGSGEHTRKPALACTQSRLPVFASRAEAEPHQLWCHWWGHCLGHQQHSDAPLRAAGNYEVMDQHTLAPTHTYIRTHTSSICSSSWFLGRLTELSISRSSGSLRKLHTMLLLQDKLKVCGWSVRWKSTTDPQLDSPVPHHEDTMISKYKETSPYTAKLFPLPNLPTLHWFTTYIFP